MSTSTLEFGAESVADNQTAADNCRAIVIGKKQRRRRILPVLTFSNFPPFLFAAFLLFLLKTVFLPLDFLAFSNFPTISPILQALTIL